MSTTLIENSQIDFLYRRVREDFRTVHFESQQLKNSPDLHAAETMEESLTRIIGDVTKGFSDDPALEEEERTIAVYTFGDFLKKVHELAAGMRELVNKDGEDINTEINQAYMSRNILTITQLYDHAITYWLDLDRLVRLRRENKSHLPKKRIYEIE